MLFASRIKMTIQNQIIMLSSLATIIIATNLLLPISIRTCRCADTTPVKAQLPPFWPDLSLDKPYRITYNLQTTSSSDRIAVDEWASFQDEQFRIDLITPVSHKSYLFNGKTNEIFRYKPFVCDRLESNSTDLKFFKDLFEGYGLTKSKLPGEAYAYGLGPLYLRATEEAKSIKLLENIDAGENKDNKKKAKEEEYLEQFTIYEVILNRDPQSGEQIPFNLRFYYLPHANTLEAIDWISVEQQQQQQQTNQSSEGGEGGGSLMRARARISLTATEGIPGSVFNIPIGYGCIRNPKFDHPLQIQQDVGLQLLHDGWPNQAVFEVTASRPLDKLLRSWESHSETLRLMRGSLKLNGELHSYYVAQIQARNLETGKLKRTKHVWSALVDAEQAVVYTIDEKTGDCVIAHRNFQNHVKIIFPGQEGIYPPLSLNTEAMIFLFQDKSNYHLISEEDITGGHGRFKEAFYEKREKFFKLEGDNEIDWIGPVSIIKQVRMFLDYSKGGAIQQLQGGDERLTRVVNYHTTLSIIFYSDDLSEIEYKAVLNLIEISDLGIGYMHKQMDISSCLDKQTIAGLLAPTKTPTSSDVPLGGTSKEQLVVKYPLATQSLAKSLFAIQDVIKELFLINLFGTTPIQPLQVSGDVSISFDNFFMFISLSIFDLPLTQTFGFKPNMKLVASSSNLSADSNALIEKMTSTLGKCEEACDFNYCYRFSFDYTKFLCRLELVKNGAKIEQAAGNVLYFSTESQVTSPWIDYYQHGGRAHLKPRAIFELLKEFAPYSEHEEGDDESDKDLLDEEKKGAEIPLRIRIEIEELASLELEEEDDDTAWILLRPISIESDTITMNEFLKEEEGGDDTNTNRYGSTATATATDLQYNLRTQYNLYFEGKEFQKGFGGELIEGVGTFEDCAAQCEDNDCRSFSYCSQNQACHTTQFYKLSEIQLVTIMDPRCSIYTLDYMSKFEDFGQVLAPAVVQLELHDLSARDCAKACMEGGGGGGGTTTTNNETFSLSFTCQGFYHCRVSLIQVTCLLVSEHIEELGQANERVRPQKRLGTIYKQNKEVNSRECRFFSRSYLSQFDQYHQKSIKFAEPLDKCLFEKSIEEIPNFGAESCAQRCIEKSTCLAFDVCINLSSSDEKEEKNSISFLPQQQQQLNHVCRIANQHALDDSRLVSKKRCTTFLLSDKSHFNSLKKPVPIKFDETDNNKSKPDKIAIEKEEEKGNQSVVVDEEQKKTLDNDINENLIEIYSRQSDEWNNKSKWSSSHWFARLISLLFGVFLSVSCISLWAKRQRIQAEVSMRFARLRSSS